MCASRLRLYALVKAQCWQGKAVLSLASFLHGVGLCSSPTGDVVDVTSCGLLLGTKEEFD